MMINKTGLILVALMVMPFLSCGKKGPLVLAPEVIPTAVENLQLFQVGDTLKLQWNFPQTLSGQEKKPLEIPEIRKIYIYHSDKEIPGGKFRKKSTLLKKLKIEDLGTASFLVSPVSPLAPPAAITATAGQKEMEKVSYFVILPFKLKELDNKVHYFGIQYDYGKKKSPLSAIVSIQTLAPVNPVTDLKVNRENKVIKLTWTRGLQDETGAAVSTIAGYAIYRKIDRDEEGEKKEVQAEAAPAAAEPGETSGSAFKRLNSDNAIKEYYEDMDTGTNGNYSYYVSAVVSKQVESAPSQVVSVRVTDVFPPEVPANLVCFKASDHLFLTWKPASDSDFSHYRLYRRTLSEKEFQLIADQITTTTYKDNDLKAGATYFYVVTSVDSKGNESDYSNEVKEQF
jgi:predicted small lipoprotein YifL